MLVCGVPTMLARILAAAEAKARRAFIFPIPLFLPAPPERIGFWRAKRAISFVQKRFAHFQTRGTNTELSGFSETE
jgi:hypothetical protein